MTHTHAMITNVLLGSQLSVGVSNPMVKTTSSFGLPLFTIDGGGVYKVTFISTFTFRL